MDQQKWHCALKSLDTPTSTLLEPNHRGKKIGGDNSKMKNYVGRIGSFVFKRSWLVWLLKTHSFHFEIKVERLCLWVLGRNMTECWLVKSDLSIHRCQKHSFKTWPMMPSKCFFVLRKMNVMFLREKMSKDWVRWSRTLLCRRTDQLPRQMLSLEVFRGL